MATGDDFYQFLTSHQCFNKFCEAIEDQHNICFDKLVAERKLFSTIIDQSINWDDTEEGSDFWHNMHNLWSTACISGIFNKLNVNCNNIWRMRWKKIN